jgi:hypothetical protein
MLCRLEGRTLVLRLVGVQGGAGEAYASGTNLALYVLILQWAARHGMERVSLSGCEPFLSKGIFQFKRKMHPEVSVPANHFLHKRLLLHVLADSPAVRDFLTANPVLALTRDARLEAVYFHDDSRQGRLDLRWSSPGVHSHRMVDLGQFLADLPRRQPL